MVKGRDVLEGEVDGEEERGEVRRGLVVKKKVGQRVRESAEERDNRLEGRDIGGGGAGLGTSWGTSECTRDAGRTTRRYSCPAADLIGKRPVRSAATH